MAKTKESETKMAEQKIMANTTRLVGKVTGFFVRLNACKLKGASLRKGGLVHTGYLHKSYWMCLQSYVCVMWNKLNNNQA